MKRAMASSLNPAEVCNGRIAVGDADDIEVKAIAVRMQIAGGDDLFCQRAAHAAEAEQEDGLGFEALGHSSVSIIGASS